MEICKICKQDCFTIEILMEHFLEKHLSQIKDIPCMFCEKNFKVFDDLMHHLELDHVGMASSLLDIATKARETKKQLGDFLDVNKKGYGVECPQCFEQFPNVQKINEHAKKEHGRQLDPNFIKKMSKITEKSVDEPPICEQCSLKFPGVVFTRIDDKIQNVCLNCYEKYFGKNALMRLTIGTNDNTLKIMRTSIQ